MVLAGWWSNPPATSEFWLADDAHQPIEYPVGSPIDMWGGDIQSPEFELG